MARKIKTLPFIVQPRLQPIIERLGNEDSGVIEIRRQGYLSVTEKTIVDQVTADMSDQGEMIAAVKAIAEGEGRTISDIFDELQNSEDNSLMNKYAMEIASASSSAKSQEDKVRVISATALLLCRIDANWTVEDTMNLHPDLIDELALLYKEEDQRSVEAFNQDQESSEEPAKKQ